MGSCFSAESRSPLPNSPSDALGARKRKNPRRRFGSRGSSFDSKKDDHLLTIPGRLFSNGSSEFASLFTQQGRKGTNQDSMIVWENFCSRTDTIFCGVFDGHGPYGHLVSKKIRDLLPQKLSAQWESIVKNGEALQKNSIKSSSMNSEETSFVSVDEESRASVDVEESEKQQDIFQILRESFLKAFKIVDRELRVYAGDDCFCSGTTAVTLIKQGQDIVIGNVGDSRAVLGTREEDDTLVAVQLTVDLKPNLPAELERIKKCRGRVFALHDEPDVARVWLPNCDSPGLAMARAFGDFCLKDFGIISVPEISYRRITEKDEFIVLASDGIWDVLTNKEVVDIVASAPSRSTASKDVVDSAVRTWKSKFPTSKIDDCAVVCLFLDSNSLYSATSDKEDEQTVQEEEPHSNTEKVDDPNGPTGLFRSGTVRVEETVPEDYSEEEEEETLEKSTDLESISERNSLSPEKKQ